MGTEKTLPGAFLRRERPPEPPTATRRRARPAAALGADPLEAWRKVFPTVRGKSLGEDGYFLQSEAPDEVNRELLAFLSEGAP